jgi:carboxymethylenebutenolidase
MDILKPAGSKGPGVLVAHAWWGLNRTIRDYGAALAREGFVVGLVDVFGGETTTSIEDAEKLIRTHWDVADKRLTEGLAELGGSDAVTGAGVGAVGFSFGGFHLLEQLGKAGPLTKLVTYYATHPLPERHAPVLAHFAAEDEFESAEDAAAMTAALEASGPANVTYTYPGTKHWFAEADRPEHDASAAKLAFERTVAFLRG